MTQAAATESVNSVSDNTEENVSDMASIIARPDFPKFEIISENIHLTERLVINIKI